MYKIISRNSKICVAWSRILRFSRCTHGFTEIRKKSLNAMILNHFRLGRLRWKFCTVFVLYPVFLNKLKRLSIVILSCSFIHFRLWFHRWTLLQRFRDRQLLCSKLRLEFNCLLLLLVMIDTPSNTLLCLWAWAKRWICAHSWSAYGLECTLSSAVIWDKAVSLLQNGYRCAHSVQLRKFRLTGNVQ